MQYFRRCGALCLTWSIPSELHLEAETGRGVSRRSIESTAEGTTDLLPGSCQPCFPLLSSAWCSASYISYRSLGYVLQSATYLDSTVHSSQIFFPFHSISYIQSACVARNALRTHQPLYSLHLPIDLAFDAVKHVHCHTHSCHAQHMSAFLTLSTACQECSAYMELSTGNTAWPVPSSLHL